ncbi:kinase-like protein [Dothidotthia symphoricarpi CBS 119687]|uniref:Kinase-like protein n=1 Tax=Dothidotthia symphoricarpi CBS 119687 TaxID=1392245 RepID=A0A6A6ABD0_9PLEO|nr:kinase-like protein [Dothidotthia symphoricarpi CBS 119687]KAF2128324.1 kinase-like protein [Dothidotthia symphoricarpi CBS 119687]
MLSRCVSRLYGRSINPSIRLATRGLSSSSMVRGAPQASARKTDTPNNTPLFSYTSGRFLFNEAQRLKERHVKFDLEALHHAAEVSLCNKHGKIISTEKLTEGGFNRVFVLTCEDGFELIAKIPYHIACPEYYATASEVATLAFLRAKGIPVPEVYGYAATKENPVGAEYILMEKASGVCLASRWAELQDVEIRRLAHSFVELEVVFSGIPFGATGSLYFKKDIPSHLQAPLYVEGHVVQEADEQFCIGPIADYMFWFGSRAGLDINRGPWTTPVEYLHSIAEKERAWTQRYGIAMEPDFPHNAIGLGVQRPEEYIKLLNDYQLLAPHLLPKNPAHPFNRPTLRHPDLTPGNIFITPETGRISCLIDWQHAIIHPHLLAAGLPRAFENPDPDLPTHLDDPTLPENLASLPDAEKIAIHALHRQRILFFTYYILTGALNKPHLAALHDPLLLGRQMLVDSAGRQWAGNLITLKGAVLRAVRFWGHFPDVEGMDCPVRFEQGEIDGFADVEDSWARMSGLVEGWRERVCGMTEEGWVRNEDFEDARDEMAELKEEIRLQCEGDEEDSQAFRSGWLFREREEFY